MGETKRCSRCRHYLPLASFAPRADTGGLRSACRSCSRSRNTELSRARRPPNPRAGKHGPDPMLPRDGDRRQARQRINVEVRSGRRARPNALPCTDCGHVWNVGERRHEYDHHLGYAAEHHYDVEPVCTICHSRRAWRRGEMTPHPAGPAGRMRISRMRRLNPNPRDRRGRFARTKETSNG